MARVELDQVTKIFSTTGAPQEPALKDINLTVADQEALVLAGPSGSGKTTLLRLIAGLDEVTHGAISIDGQIVNRTPPEQRDIAMVFQSFALYPHMTVWENLAFGLKLRKFPRAEIESRVREAADLLRLTPVLERLPQQLSGGERQRVALGRAMVRKPKVFLFDEPLSNLDAPLRAQLRRDLVRLRRRLAATLIYVTHDQVEAMSIGDRIAVLRQGVIQQVGSPTEVYRRPANLFVATFIGSPPMNLFHGTLRPREGGLWFEEQTPGDNPPPELRPAQLQLPESRASSLPAFVDQRIIMGIRPGDLGIMCPNSSFSAAGKNSFLRGRVELVEPLGDETFLHLTTGGHPFIVKMKGETPVQLDETVTVQLNLERAHFFDGATEQALAAF